MKRITLLATVAAAVLAVGLNGCSKDKIVLQGGEPCRLVLTGKALRTETKVETEPLSGGMELGVHIVDRTSGEDLNNAALTNIKHVTDASGAISNANPDPIILTTGYIYDVYAYSPYDAGVTAATSSAVRVAHGQDVLWAKTAGEKPNAATHTVALTFERKAAQIAFRIEADGASKPDITGATIRVTGFSKEGTLDLATGKVTRGEVDKTIELTETEKTICFLPDEEQMELEVTVTIPAGPNAGTYSGVKKEIFRAGQSTVITVTVIDRNSVLSLEAGVVPWVDETGNVDVNN